MVVSYNEPAYDLALFAVHSTGLSVHLLRYGLNPCRVPRLIFEIRFTDGAEVVAFTYIPPNVVMCVSDGNPKPNVTINGTDIREVGKGVVKAEVTGKKVQLWCHAENSLKRASKRLTGNAAGGFFFAFVPCVRPVSFPPAVPHPSSPQVST